MKQVYIWVTDSESTTQLLFSQTYDENLLTRINQPTSMCFIQGAAIIVNSVNHITTHLDRIR